MDSNTSQPQLNYPWDLNTRIWQPSLFYIDDEGIPIQLALNREQVLAIVDDWNDGDLNPDEPRMLPPRE
mgnify:CR=1 FL=1